MRREEPFTLSKKQLFIFKLCELQEEPLVVSNCPYLSVQQENCCVCCVFFWSVACVQAECNSASQERKDCAELVVALG